MGLGAFGGGIPWSFVSQFEVGEGMLAAAAMLLFLGSLEYLGLGSLLSHPLLTRHARFPFSRVWVFFALLGALSFGIMVLCNFRRLEPMIDINGWDLVQYPLSVLGYLGGSAMGNGGRVGYGVLAVLVWGFTAAALSLGVGLARATRLFVLPSVLFLTLVVLFVDPREMDSQAINLVSGVTFEGISLLSNWSLLTVSLYLTILSLGYGRLDRSRDHGRSRVSSNRS